MLGDDRKRVVGLPKSFDIQLARCPNIKDNKAPKDPAHKVSCERQIGEALKAG